MNVIPAKAGIHAKYRNRHTQGSCGQGVWTPAIRLRSRSELWRDKGAGVTVRLWKETLWPLMK
jgi:hypothetical protein